MCKIIKIQKIDPEVYITVTDGLYEVVAFSDCDKFNIGEELDNELKAFGAINVMSSFDEECLVKIIDSSSYLQHIVGVLTDRDLGIVHVGNIKIYVSDYIPKDINNGQFIEFDVARVDIW